MIINDNFMPKLQNQYCEGNKLVSNISLSLQNFSFV